MLYGIVFLIIFLIIVVIWIIRIMSNASRRARMRNASPAIRDAELGNRPTFSGTARDVSDRVFGPSRQGAEYVHHLRQDGGYGSWESPSAVVRTDNEGADPELPSYNDRTTISVPQAAYSSPITSRHETQRQTAPHRPPSIGEAPPKYDEAPPIVRVA